MSGIRPWFGRNHYVGLHYDLHARADDTELGTKADPKLLVPMLKLMNPDWVQTDCKGHAGYTSWFSTVSEASVPAGLSADALAQWRDATAQLGVPLHCHYSGLWDSAAGARHPTWAVKGPDGKAVGAPFSGNGGKPTNDVMCPRGPYLEKLLIPQMKELVDRYRVNGFWVDGEIWAARPCYCRRCLAAWKKESGTDSAPTEQGQPCWTEWLRFTRRSFYEYVTRYCVALHAHDPEVRLCSNWLSTFRDPGEPSVPTDWISGDNIPVFGLDGSRCEARFLSTRGKPWDIMIWAFYSSHGHGNPQSPWSFKSTQMLMQEAAVLTAFGGNVQIYEHPPVRDGRLVPWRQRRLGEVVRFIRKRRALCQGTQTVPQIAVLHSEHHLHETMREPNLFWGVDTRPVEGAVFSLLENHFGVDVLDEWALLQRIEDFPVVVVPEQHALSPAMRESLAGYLRRGGKVLATGARLFDRLGAEIVGARAAGMAKERSYAVQAGGGEFAAYCEEWLMLEPEGADVLRTLGDGCFLDGCDTGRPAAVRHRVGKGRIVYVPWSLFAEFHRNRYPLTRVFAGELVRSLAGRFPIEVDAPVSVDVTLRCKSGQTIIHLVNRSSGIPNQPNNGAIDEIPHVGPITVTVSSPSKSSGPPKSSRSPESSQRSEPSQRSGPSGPARVERLLEAGAMDWSYAKGKVTVKLASIHIHTALRISA